jgi:hypothetical protein
MNPRILKIHRRNRVVGLLSQNAGRGLKGYDAGDFLSDYL